MYLVDTNVWLELLLEQEKSEKVYKFLKNIEASLLSITDFSLYSIGIILSRLKKLNLFEKFIEDIITSGVNIIRINPEEIKEVTKIIEKFGLDFDD